MNVNHLRYFTTIARTNSIAAASEELYVSSPSLSYAIKSLEQELGAPLFITSNKGAFLTEYGRLFLPYAVNALEFLDNGVSELSHAIEEKQVINVASTGSVIVEQVPWYVKQFSLTKEGQQAKINIQMYSATECIQMVESGYCDVAFTILDDLDNSPDLETYPVAFDKYYAIFNCKHELLEKEKISMEDLLPYDFISFSKNTAAYQEINNRFERECGRTPNIVASFDYSFQIAGMVAADLGISITPDREMGLDVSNKLVFREIDNKPWIRTLGLVYRKESCSRKVFRNFIDFIKKWSPEPIPATAYPDQYKGKQAVKQSSRKHVIN